MEGILLQGQSVPDRRTAAYTNLLRNAFNAVPFTQVELIEIGHMLHGLTVEQASKERRVVPVTTKDIRKHIKYKLGAGSLAGAMDRLCRQAFALVPPLEDDMTPMMRKLTPAEEHELQLVAAGLGTKESADARGVTFNTAHTHRTSLRIKRAAHTMAGVILNDYRLQAYTITYPEYTIPSTQGAGYSPW